MSHEIWIGVCCDFDVEDLCGCRAVVGLDLGSTTDLIGFVFLVELVDLGELWRIVLYAWFSEVGLWEKFEKDCVFYM